MIPQHQRDPIIALWQSAPAPDAHQLLKDLERQKQLHQRLRRTILAILSGIGVLLIFEEATGRIASYGVLSTLWNLGLAIGLVYRRRAACGRTDGLTLDLVSLLKRMLAQARRDLFLARCLYAGVPLGALAGYVVVNLVGVSTVPPAPGSGRYLHAVQTGGGIAALLAMMLAGVLLERSRRIQVQDLSHKLRSITDDM
ncbi:hypothetical protein [Paludibaculum fermentans]|uniref:hypothetical protein n=1 Tax=Paludibaculum fermentans TaxID=1473598 RepID=UPI003EBD65E6